MLQNVKLSLPAKTHAIGFPWKKSKDERISKRKIQIEYALIKGLLLLSNSNSEASQKGNIG